MSEGFNFTCPSDQPEPAMRKLCEVLADAPGITVGGSCGGHEGGICPPGEWHVSFTVDPDEDHRPSLEGWLTLEFVSWAIHDNVRAGNPVSIKAVSSPPWLNWPGRMLMFMIEGEAAEGGIEADELAEFIDSQASYYVTAEQLHERYRAQRGNGNDQ